MTISEVLACSIHKGDVEYYRRVKIDVKLLPKVKIEIVVSEIPVNLVVATARRVLYTMRYMARNSLFSKWKMYTGEDGRR